MKLGPNQLKWIQQHYGNQIKPAILLKRTADGKEETKG